MGSYPWNDAKDENDDNDDECHNVSYLSNKN